MFVIPVIGAMFGITAEVANFARKHDVIYANSQKAFVLAAIAANASSPATHNTTERGNCAREGVCGRAATEARRIVTECATARGRRCSSAMD